MEKFNENFRKIGKKLIVRYSGEKVVLPKHIQARVDAYWITLLKSGRKLTRGEGFHITDIVEDKEKITVTVALSDYAHYIFSRHIGMDSNFAFKNIHTSCLIETADDFLIIGMMGKHTSIAGNVQCVGGGLGNSDLKGKTFDLRRNIKRELLEEAGMNVVDKKTAKSLKLEYIKYNKKLNTIAAIFILKLKISARDFQKRYALFEKRLAKKGEVPEFGEIFYVKKIKKEVERFIRGKTQPDHYLKYLLREVVKK